MTCKEEIGHPLGMAPEIADRYFEWTGLAIASEMTSEVTYRLFERENFVIARAMPSGVAHSFVALKGNVLSLVDGRLDP